MKWCFFLFGFNLLTLVIHAMDNSAEILVVATVEEDWQFVQVSTSRNASYEKTDTALRETDNFLQSIKNGKLTQPIQLYLEKLKKTQQLLFTLARRTSPTFPEDVTESYKRNVASVGLDPKQAYEYFGLSAQQAKGLPYSHFKTLIEKECRDIVTSDKRKAELRQLGYVFSNSDTKNEYDAYLEGRPALEKLMLSSQEAEHIKMQLNNVIQRTMIVSELLENISAVTKGIPTSLSKEHMVTF